MPAVSPLSVPDMVKVELVHVNVRSTVLLSVELSHRSPEPTALPVESATYTVKSPNGVEAPAYRTSNPVSNDANQ